jgi:hypothetical protein
MTSEEAFTLIESASDPYALFGSDPSRQYRRLARLTHPDSHPGDRRAAAAFGKLAALWQRRNRGAAGRTDQLFASGDLANLYEHERGLLKIARDPADNDLIEREASALVALRARGDKRYLAYVPVIAGSQLHKDPVSGIRRRANVIGKLAGFATLAEVKAAYPAGVDPRDAAWMWRRLLVAIGLAHQVGLVHAAVLPEHVLIHPGDHGLVLIDWCYAVSQHAGRAVAIPGKYADWYPAEVLDRQPIGPDLDIYLATKCLTDLIGDGIPAQLAAFARGCTLPNPRRRPDDAWRLLGELDEVFERLYGARKYRPFALCRQTPQEGNHNG